MAVALIVAAGRGQRLGAGEPKAFVRVCGRSLLEWSVSSLQAVQRVQQIVVALPADHLGVAPAGATPVPGGATRSESVAAALAATDARALSVEGEEYDDVVIVHDAARIFAGPDLFNAAIDELIDTGADAVVAAAPVTDTIKQTAGTAAGSALDLQVTGTVDRSRLWSVQTPQVFRRGALQAALASSPELIARATDDAWLIEQHGGTVVVLPSTAENFKVTTPLDLRLAELVLSQRLSG